MKKRKGHKDGALTPAALRRMRAALGLTQKELGDRIGCDAATISRLESGATPIKYQHLIRLRSVPEFART